MDFLCEIDIPDDMLTLADIEQHEHDLMEYGIAFQDNQSYENMSYRFHHTFGE